MQLIKKIFPYIKISLICLLIASSILSVVGGYTRARELVDTDGPFFVEWEKRFNPIKEELPFTRGVIGYAADWDVPGVSFEPANSEAEHILTQFTMAPIIVSRDTSREWIIANMDADNFESWLALQEGEFTVTKYKYNLYLLHRIQ
jgi:hypothetical protein